MHHNVWNGFPKYTTKEFEKKSEPTETGTPVWFLEIYLKFETNAHRPSIIYDRRDNFNFAIINVPHIASSIITSPTYIVYISDVRREI
jgi:hypothetical protein